MPSESSTDPMMPPPPPPSDCCGWPIGGGGGGIIGSVLDSLGIGGGGGGDGSIDQEKLEAAESMVAAYAELLQVHLEENGRWAEVRAAAAEAREP